MATLLLVVTIGPLVPLYRAAKVFGEFSAPEAQAPCHLENSTGTGEER